MSARAICLKHGIEFSTSFHTRFPEYVRARFPLIPEELVYRWLRWFHGPATAMMVATESLKREMQAHGFTNLRIWSRGVDVDHFHPIAGAHLPYDGPVWLYVGRVAVEKNIEAFLELDLPGTKVVVGRRPGPDRTGSPLSRRALPGRACRARLWSRPMPAATSSSFPAAPTRSAWFCWRRWPAAFPWPPTRSRGPWTWWGTPPWAALDEDLESSLPEGSGDRPPSRRPHPPPLRRGAFLAGLHPAIPAQYHRRTGRALSKG